MNAIVKTQKYPAMTLIGVSRDFISVLGENSDAHTILPALWGELFDHLDELDEFEFTWSVGVLEPPKGKNPKPGQLSYFAGLLVEEVPEDLGPLRVLDVPAGNFAVCEHIGDVENIGETTAWFYNEYLESSGLEEREAPHYEIYDDRFDPESPDSVIVIAAPIE
jgi:AraC family transcriptional regulator